MEKIRIDHSGKTSCESEHPYSSHESWQEKIIIKMLKDAGTLNDVYIHLKKIIQILMFLKMMIFLKFQ